MTNSGVQFLTSGREAASAVLRLWRAETDVLRAEIEANLARVASAAITVVIGGVLLFAGCLFLLAAIVFVLIANGIPPYAASGGLALLLCLGAWILLRAALARLQASPIAPRRFLEQLRRDVGAWRAGAGDER